MLEKVTVAFVSYVISVICTRQLGHLLATTQQKQQQRQQHTTTTTTNNGSSTLLRNLEYTYILHLVYISTCVYYQVVKYVAR